MNTIIINADLPLNRINRHIYGHFAEHLGHCIYGGFWVGEDSEIPNTRGIRNDVVEALRRIRIPNLRWPGGCFADEYHWRDGVGPRSKRPSMVNTHWGGIVEDNSFGTHEFMDLCEQLETEPYICGNVGSGTVREMSEWVEYLTSGSTSTVAQSRRENGRDEPWTVRYWGIGNENWGCGGNMRVEYYADLYRRFAVYCRNYGENKLFKIAGGPNVDDYHWTEVLMREAGRSIDGLSLHYYCQTRFAKEPVMSSATEFDEAAWFDFLARAHHMDELITRHSAIMDQYDPECRVALVVDEWGSWYEVEPGTNPGFLYQQNTMRDALIASITLSIFNDHSERVRIANLAQTVNVLQAPILTEGDTVVLTPTYHVFDLYKEHQDAERIPMSVTSEPYEFEGRRLNAVGGSASRSERGDIHVTLHNIDPTREHTVKLHLRGVSAKSARGRVLTAPAMNSHNTAATPHAVAPADFSGFELEGEELTLVLPAMSVVALTILTTGG
ncbi:MAG: alpha-N-arabinofuranosidase [Spirochaetota bacterium]